MESVSSFYKKENDLVYIAGRINGRKEGREEVREEARAERDALFVRNLLTKTDLGDEKIAQLTYVPISFVQAIRASL